MGSDGGAEFQSPHVPLSGEDKVDPTHNEERDDHRPDPCGGVGSYLYQVCGYGFDGVD